MNMNAPDWIALSGAAIALLTGIGSIIAARHAYKQAKDAASNALLAQQEATRIANEAARLQALDWTDQFFAGVREWGEEVVDSISRCIHLPEIEDDDTRKQLWGEARVALSARIDRGRWFFPNKYEKAVGTDKEPAYRGLRRLILKHIVDAYQAVEACPSYADRSTHSKLVTCQRGFVSEVQAVLNPRHREDQIKTVLDRFGIADQMRNATDSEKEDRPK